jgi:hypothetical protein
MAYETTHEPNEKAIDQLNSFLRGELSACETYRQAIDKLGDSQFRGELESCLRSHEARVSELRDRIGILGGRPSEGSGPWGGFAKLVEAGAKLFGAKSAIAALEEGEDHGLKDYKRDLGDLDVESRLLAQRMLAEQERTHAVVSGLKHQIS